MTIVITTITITTIIMTTIIITTIIITTFIITTIIITTVIITTIVITLKINYKKLRLFSYLLLNRMFSEQHFPLNKLNKIMLFWQLWNCKKLSEDILQKEIVSKLKIYVDDTELKYQPLTNQLFCVFNITMNKLISLIIKSSSLTRVWEEPLNSFLPVS